MQTEENKWHLLLHPEDQSRYVEAFQRAVAEQTAFRRSSRPAQGWRVAMARFIGRTVAVDLVSLGHVGLSLDITERKRT